jgi:hypothetical protein
LRYIDDVGKTVSRHGATFQVGTLSPAAADVKQQQEKRKKKEKKKKKEGKDQQPRA